jgi:hypothetical protein
VFSDYLNLEKRKRVREKLLISVHFFCRYLLEKPLEPRKQEESGNFKAQQTLAKTQQPQLWTWNPQRRHRQARK